jgi:hypothetical protein
MCYLKNNNLPDLKININTNKNLFNYAEISKQGEVI